MLEELYAYIPASHSFFPILSRTGYFYLERINCLWRQCVTLTDLYLVHRNSLMQTTNSKKSEVKDFFNCAEIPLTCRRFLDSVLLSINSLKSLIKREPRGNERDPKISCWKELSGICICICSSPICCFVACETHQL